MVIEIDQYGKIYCDYKIKKITQPYFWPPTEHPTRNIFHWRPWSRSPVRAAPHSLSHLASLHPLNKLNLQISSHTAGEKQPQECKRAKQKRNERENHEREMMSDGSAMQFAVVNNQSSVNTEKQGLEKESRVSLPSSKPKGETARRSTS